MKTIILLVAILVFTSCFFPEKENYPVEYKLEVINNSGVDIKIIGFDRSFRTETLIPNSKTVLKSYYSLHRGKSYTFSDMFDGDSIKTIFGMKKVDFFHCYINVDEGCNKPRNILNPKYTIINNNSSKNNRIFLHRFTFEPIDYQNAKDCNGNCE